jgi:hypothetical protein
MSEIRIRQGNTLYPIVDIIRRVGKDILKKGLKNGVYTIGIDANIENILRARGFNKKSIPVAINNIKRGKCINQLVKKTGKVVKVCIGEMIYQTIDDADYHGIVWTFGNRISWLYIYGMMEACIARRKTSQYMPKPRLTSIGYFDDKLIDPITCDDIVRPVYIIDDWKMGCKIWYDSTTIQNFRAMKQVIVGYDIINGVEMDIIREIPEEPEYYISPYTRNRFTRDSIAELVIFHDSLAWKTRGIPV